MILAATIALVLVAMIAIACAYIEFVSNPSTESQAIERFKDRAKTGDVVVISHSDNRPILGRPKTVIYQLRVKGQDRTGKCEVLWLSREVFCKFTDQ